MTDAKAILGGTPKPRGTSVLKAFFDKLFYGGYETASKTAAGRVVARYSRGNTSVQFGRYLTSQSMEELRANGDRAAARLARRAERAKI